MKLRRLHDPLHRRHLGQHIPQQTTLIEQFEATTRSAFDQDARQLVANPLGRHTPDGRMQPADRLHRFTVDREAEPGGESHRPQHPQVILAEPPFGIADRPHDARREIRATTGVVDHFSRRGIEHQRVDGEVATQHILPRVALEDHTARMTTIHIAVVATEGGHLHLRVTIPHQHHAEMRPHQAGLGKKRQHLIRCGVRGNIEIFGIAAKQQVAHAAAHQKGGEPGGLQPPDCPFGQ